MGLALKECGRVTFAEERKHVYSRSIQEFIISYKMSTKKDHGRILGAIVTAVDHGT